MSFADSRHCDRSGRDARGAALIAALLVVAFLGTVGAALVLLTSTDVVIAGNFHSSAEALYAADALIERVRRDLGAMTDWTAALNGSVASTFVDGSTTGLKGFAGGSVNLDELVNQANCQRATACSPSDLDRVTVERPWGADNPRWRVFACGTLGDLLGTSPADAGLYVVALVGDDGAENDGMPDQDGIAVGVVPNAGLGVLTLRAEAFGSGGVHRAVQVTVVRDRGVPAAGGAPEVRIVAWRELR
jgi:hypothetical protein